MGKGIKKPLINDITGAEDTPAPQPAAPVWGKLNGIVTMQPAQPDLGGPSPELVQRIGQEVQAHREVYNGYVRQLQQLYAAHRQQEDAIQGQAMNDARKAYPGLPDDQLTGWASAQAKGIREQLEAQKHAAAQAVPDNTIRHLLGLHPGGDMAKAIGQRTNTVQQGEAADKAHPERSGIERFFSGLDVGATAALNTLRGTEKYGFDQSEIEDGKGNLAPEFKRKLFDMTGGNLSAYRETGRNYLKQALGNYDASPSIAADVTGKAMDLAHSAPEIGSAMINKTLGTDINIGAVPVVSHILRSPYYLASGALSGLKAAVKAGTTIGYGISSALPGGDQQDINRQYANTLHGIEQYQTQSGQEGSPSLGNLDAVLGSTSRFMGEMEALAPLAKLGGAPDAQAAFDRALSNTAANKVYSAVNKVVQGLSDARLPAYLDNVVSTGKMFFPSMYADYYADALHKGYSPDQAATKAAERATVAIAAMGLGNWAGAGKTPLEKLPGQILNGVEREAATSFLGKAGQFTQSAIRRFDPKNAAAGAAGMGASAFLDGVQDHYDDIERGRIAPDTPLDIDHITQQAAESGLVGFLSMGISHLVAGGHGTMPADPQAHAIYQAAADPKAFRATVARQVERGKLSEQEGAALTGFVSRIAEPATPGEPSLLHQGYAKTKSPESAVKWAIEQARLQETAQAIAGLSQKTEVVRMVDEQGAPVEKVYARDAEGNMTEAAGRELDSSIKDLQSKAAESQRAIQQLEEGSAVRGRTVSGDELLRLTAKFTPEGSLTTRQADRILAEGPFVSQQVDITPYAADPRVNEMLAKLQQDPEAFKPQHANDPILGSQGEIIDGAKRVAYALSQGQTAMSVLRPRTTREAVQSAQEEHQSTLGPDQPQEQLSTAAQSVQEAYKAGLTRAENDQDRSLGLTQPAARALFDAAATVAHLPHEEAMSTLQEATAHNLPPADAEHLLHLVRGEKPAESVFDPPSFEHEESQPSQEADTHHVFATDPEIIQSPLWDQQANRPRQGVSADDLAEFQITGEVPEHLKHLAPEAMADDNIQPQATPEATKPEIAHTPDPVNYTTSSGNRVFVENGQLQVVNKDGRPVSEGTRRKAILEAAANHDFTAGQGVVFPEGAEHWPSQKIEQHVADTSNNPSELATVWLSSEKEGQSLSAVEDAIARQGVGLVTTASFDQFGDRSYRTQSLAKTYLNNEKGASIDQVAQEISDAEGIEVTPQDIVDFMVRFPNAEHGKTFLSEAAGKAAERFRELTGFALDEKASTTKKIAEIAQRQGIEKETGADHSALDNFLEHEYTTREHLERDYENAIQAGHFNPAAEGERPGASLADAQSPEIQSQPRGESGTPAQAGADEQPADGSAPDSIPGEQASSVIGEPVDERANVRYYVTGAEINAAGWAKKKGVGTIQDFAARLRDKFGSKVSIVNKDQMRRLTGRDAEAYMQNGELFINIEHSSLKPSALLEESAHLWIEWARNKATEIHDKGIELARQSPLFRYMEALHTGTELPEGLTPEQQREAAAYVAAYRNHADPLYSLANEVLAKAIRDEGKSLSTEPDMRRNFGKWLESFWTSVKSAMGFSDLSAPKFAQLTLKDFARRAAEEIGSGNALTDRIKTERTRAQAMRERAEKQAKTIERTTDEQEAGDRLDIAGARPTAFVGEGMHIVEGSTAKEEPLHPSPEIAAIGQSGGNELASIIQKKNPELYDRLIDAAGTRDALDNMLDNPEAMSPEEKEAMGLSYGPKARGGSRELAPGLMQEAFGVISDLVKNTHSPAEIVRGLAEFHEEQQHREAEHQRNMQRGRDNQQAGQEKKRRARGEQDFVDALMQSFKEGKGYGRDVAEVAQRFGIKDPEVIQRAIDAAASKMAGEPMFSLSADHSPKDEREDLLRMLTDAAENPDTFPEEAVKIISAAYKAGILDLPTAKDMHRAARETVSEDQMYRMLADAKSRLLPEEKPQQAAEPPPDKSPTALKNAVADDELQQMGKSPRMKQAAALFPDVWSEAMQAVDEDPGAASDLVDQHHGKRFAPTALQNALLLHEKITLQLQLDKAEAAKVKADEAGDAVESVRHGLAIQRLTDRLNKTYDVISTSGTESSDAFRFRQQMAKEDYSLVNMERQARAAKGVPLTEPEKAEVKKKVERVKKAAEKLEQHETKTREKKAKEAAKEQWDRTRRTAKTEGKKAPLASLQDRWKAKLGIGKDKMYSLSVTDAEGNPVPKSEIKAMVSDFYHFFAENEPNLSVEAATAKVKEALTELLPEATEPELRDIYSGYGETRKPNTDPIAKTEREWKEQARLVSSLELAMAGEAPKRSGYQRGDKSARVRELYRQVKKMMEDNGIVSKDPEKQLKTSLDAAKRAVRNQIEDLNRQILSKKREPRSVSNVKSDTELLSLRAQRDHLRQTLDQIDPANHELTDEQRITLAEKALERAIEQKKQAIASGNIDPQKHDAVTGGRLDELRTESEDLTRQIAEMRKAKYPPKSPEEVATTNAIKAKQKALDEINRQINEHDLAAKRRQSKVDKDNAELKALDESLKTAREARKSLKDAAGITDQENLEKWKKTIARNLEKVRERRKNQQYEPAAKKERILDEEGVRLQAEYDREKGALEGEIARYRYNNKKGYEKFFDAASKIQLANKISGIYVLGKLVAVDILSPITRAIDDAGGHALAHIPGFRRIGAKAYSEGKVTLKEATEFAKGFVHGLKQIPKILHGGKGDLRSVYGKEDHGYEKKFKIDLVFHIHEALKNPTYEGVFYQQVERVSNNMLRAGIDVTDPVIKDKIMNEAHQAGLRAIYANDNSYAKFIRGVVRLVETPAKKTGNVTVGQKFLGFLIHTFVPVNRVPSNILAEIATRLGGTAYTIADLAGRTVGEAVSAKDVEGYRRVTEAWSRMVEKLTPEQADSIYRTFKKGNTGLAFTILGLLLYGAIGGKRNPDAGEGEVKEGEISLNGVPVPKWMLENTGLQAMEYAATARRLYDKYTEDDMAPGSALSLAGLKSFMGIASEVPFVNATARMTDVLHAKGTDKPASFVSDWAKSNFVPALLQDAAKLTDKDEGGFFLGHTVQRVPEKASQVGFWPHTWEKIKTGLPGLRQTVPKREE